MNIYIKFIGYSELSGPYTRNVLESMKTATDWEYYITAPAYSKVGNPLLESKAKEDNMRGHKYIIEHLEDWKAAEIFEAAMMGSPADYVEAEEAGWNPEEQDLADWLMENADECRYNLAARYDEDPESLLEYLPAAEFTDPNGTGWEFNGSAGGALWAVTATTDGDAITAGDVHRWTTKELAARGGADILLAISY